jgi:hypothetical protein
MRPAIDLQSQDCLRNLREQTIQKIAGRRYPGVVGYSDVRIYTASGESYVVTLRIVDAVDEMEVCVPEIRPLRGTEGLVDLDSFQVGDFLVTQVFVLQRKEFIEKITTESSDKYVGTRPREHRLTEVDSGQSSGAQLVDAGIALVGAGGLSVELYADSFPLIYQLRLSLAASVVPVPKRVPVT